VNRTAQDGTQQYLSFDVVPYAPEEPGAGLLVIVADDTAAGELEQALAQDRNELRLTRTRLAEANAELQRLNRLKSICLRACFGLDKHVCSVGQWLRGARARVEEVSQ
jgi:hypothetical protein